MHSARVLALLVGLLATTLAPLPIATIVHAQESDEIPPLPRPRPDRSAGGEEGTTAEPGAAAEALAAFANIPQPVTLSARITEGGDPIPDGLVWRIFDSTPDANGELALVAKADATSAEVELPPGEYLVHVAYGRAQMSRSLSVVPGNNTFDVALDAGALRLNSAVTGEIPILPTLLKFDIMTAGDETSRAMVAEGISANEIVTLNAGTYHVVSHFGTINAVVRADLRVEPGEVTDATLYHHASEVSFKLVSEEGGEAIADVEWTVQTADGETVFTDRGAFPSTVLGEGEYVIFAKQGDQVYNRQVQIQPGSAREIEVLSTIY